MYELVPPSSKLIDYKSVYFTDDTLIFKLKVFDFDEDEKYSQIFSNSLKYEDGKVVKDEKGNHIIDNEHFYIEMLKLGLSEVKGLKTKKFKPDWKLVKELVNEIMNINSVTDLEK